MEIHSQNYQYNSNVYGPGQNTNDPSALPENPGKTAEKKINETPATIMSNLVDLLSGDLGATKTGTGKTGKSDPTSLSSVLVLPEDAEMLENLDTLLALLQMECSETQLKMIKDRITALQKQIDARCKGQINNINESCKQLQEQLKQEKARKALMWLGVALAIAMLFVTIFTGGAAAIAVAAVAAALTTISAIATETGGMDKMMDKLARSIAKTFDLARKDAEKVASGLMVAFQVAVMVASICAGNIGAVTKAASLAVLGLRIAVSGLQAATGIASGALGIAAANTSFKTAMLNIELMQLKKLLQVLEERLNEEQDSLQDVVQMLQSNVAVLKNLLTTENDITDDITKNIGLAMA